MGGGEEGKPPWFQMHARGLGKDGTWEQIDFQGITPPSFNLTSALHHVCGAVTLVHECCNGVVDDPYPQVGHEQLLDLELILFDELLQFAVENPVRWTG